MVAECRDAMHAGIEAADPTSPAHGRYQQAHAALLDARPSDSAVLAMQVRWLAGEQSQGDHEGDRGLLEHVTKQLEALARPPAA